MRPLILAAVALAATASAGAPRDPVPAAVPTGRPESCIPLRAIRRTEVRSDDTIDFVMAGRDRVYRNVLPGGCPGLGAERRFAYATSLGQLCSADIVTVLYQTGSPRGASCGLGRFQPVRLSPPAR